MAIVGSTIFDQTMFGKDIDKQMATTIEHQTQTLTQKRVSNIDSKLLAFQEERIPWIRSIRNCKQTLMLILGLFKNQ